MHLMNLGRPALIETALARLPRRYRRRLEEPGSKVRVIGIFEPRRGGAWFLGLRFGAPRRRPLYARLYEVRTAQGWAVLAVPTSASFDWRDYREDLYQGDNVPACRRLRRLAERQDKMIGGQN